MYGETPGNKEELYAFSPVNFANIAKEMGCWGRRVEDPAQIQEAVRRYFIHSSRSPSNS
jgi:thiamine pyrophosphate-dependent acetolactate synthase large subunit-like protein